MDKSSINTPIVGETYDYVNADGSISSAVITEVKGRYSTGARKNSWDVAASVYAPDRVFYDGKVWSTPPNPPY